MLRPLVSQRLLSACYSRRRWKNHSRARIFPATCCKMTAELRVCPSWLGLGRKPYNLATPGARY